MRRLCHTKRISLRTALQGTIFIQACMVGCCARRGIEPLPTRSTPEYGVLYDPQVQRLVAVLSLPAISKSALLDDKPLDVAGLSPGERATLAAAGWVPGTGVRSLINFNGGGSGLPHLPCIFLRYASTTALSLFGEQCIRKSC